MGTTLEQRRVARLGRYAIVRPLGTGGMAELFLARADGIEGFSRLCAVKRILPHKAKNERFVRMFLNEAKLVAALNHPNIAAVHDIGEQDGEYYFAMEYVHGCDLRHVIHAAPKRRIRIENALYVVINVCAGLHHAHEARDEAGRSLDIVHRDVSPSNVLISYQGAIKLVDFGVAKAANLVSETREGIVKGKYGYMSPEQCLGEQLDRRSDVFAIGILLWELTVGRRLYKSNGELVALQRVVYADAARPSRFIANYPPELERIVMRALARDRRARYQTAQDLQLDLEAFARDRKLPISPIAMADEMRMLFRDRLDAWRAAEQAGHSLADHLAALSEDSAPESSEHDEDDLDGVLNQLDTGMFEATSPIAEGPAAFAVAEPTVPDGPAPATEPTIPVTPIPRHPSGGAQPTAQAKLSPPSASTHGGARGSAPRAASVAAPIPVIVAPPRAPRRGRALPLILIVFILGVFATGWLLMGRARRHRDAAPRDPLHEQAASHAPGAVVTLDHQVEVQEISDMDSADRATAGPMDPQQVRNKVRAHRAEVEACVEKATTGNVPPSGQILARIEVTGDGHVAKATAMASQGASPELEACILAAAATWTFAAPAGAVDATFTYPLTF